MAESMRVEFAVYLRPDSLKDPQPVLRDLLGHKYSTIRVVEEIPNQSQTVMVHSRLLNNAREDYAPPTLESLKYQSGVNREEMLMLRHSKRALVLDFAFPKAAVWTGLKTANELIEELARMTNGFVWDNETREVFSPDSWHKKRLSSWTSTIPDIATQTVIHLYNNGEYERAITLGMAKVGLPDVVVQELPWSSEDQVGDLINIFCQSAVEGSSPTVPGMFTLDLRSIKNDRMRNSQLKGLAKNASGLACLSLTPGQRDKGDADNRLIALGSDRYSGNDLHAKQENMLSSFLGSSDSIRHIKHNEELLEESRRAKSKLPVLREAFNRGLEPGEYIQVKAPFATPEGNTEWMWVEVTKWNSGKIRGLLMNDPFEIPTMHSGQAVEVSEKDVFDYIRHFADSHDEGNTTGEIIQKMQDERKGLSVRDPVIPQIKNCETLP